MSRRLSSLAGALIASFLFALAGCQSEPESSRDLTMSRVQGIGLEDAAIRADRQTPSEAIDRSEPDLSSAEAIAAQFERDMAAFHALQAERREQSEYQGDGGQTTVAPPITSNPPTSGDAAGALTSAASEAGSTPHGPTVEPMEPPAATLDDAMALLRRELATRASAADQPLREYLLMAALTLVEPSRALDPEALADLLPRERELLAAYQEFFRRVGEEMAASGEEAALIDAVDDLRIAIEERGPLRIADARFCTRVDGFGAYENFDRNAFLAGRAQQVVVYTEIEEFTSAQDEEGMWKTDLWQELIIYNSYDNVPIWQQEWQAAPDVAARKRTDFFISHLVTLPELLPVGSYTMKVRVKDGATDSIAEAGISFAIVADAKLAATVRD